MVFRTDDVASSLLRCPVGCAFLLTIARDRIPVALAVTPHEACARAVVALRALNPWSGSFERAVSAVLSRGSDLTSLARAAADHPESRWWRAPLDRTRQVLVSKETPHPPSHKASPESLAHWEAYAQRPVGWRMTSTLSGGYSCLDTVIARGDGDWMEPETYRRFAAQVDESARILEISAPADWHALCAAFPCFNQDPNSPAGAGSLSPDWDRVAAQWDGVHLTFLGLLTTPFVRYSSEAGNTMLWSWDTEGTMWLPGEFLRAGAPLPPLDCCASEIQVINPLTERDLGLPDWPPDAGLIRY